MMEGLEIVSVSICLRCLLGNIITFSKTGECFTEKIKLPKVFAAFPSDPQVFKINFSYLIMKPADAICTKDKVIATQRRCYENLLLVSK
jgi:hypothetical protein